MVTGSVSGYMCNELDPLSGTMEFREMEMLPLGVGGLAEVRELYHSQPVYSKPIQTCLLNTSLPHNLR